MSNYNVLEKIISNQMVTFLDKHSVLTKSEFGFRKYEVKKMQYPKSSACLPTYGSTAFCWTLTAFSVS
jgi:hypothetical protein